MVGAHEWQDLKHEKELSAKKMIYLKNEASGTYLSRSIQPQSVVACCSQLLTTTDMEEMQGDH